MSGRIISKSMEMFSRYGIKHVNMDAIAAELGISKRTLYEKFSNKDALVSAAIESLLSQLWQDIEFARQSLPTHLETILQVNETLCRYAAYFCPAFCRDVYLYEDAKSLILTMESQLRSLYSNLFEAGVSEGIFLPGEDYEMLITLYASLFQTEQNSFRQPLMHTLLRGVSSAKGIRELEKYKVSDSHTVLL